MNLTVLKRNFVTNPRFFSKAALVVTILPLWALWFYAYATLRSLESEVEVLARSYGMYLYKQQAQYRLEGAARRMILLEEQRSGGIEGGRVEGLSREEWDRFRVLFEPEEVPILVERTGLRILCPSEPPYGSASFLDDPEGRTAFLRTLKRMEEEGLRRGYFSIDSSESPDRSERRTWFLAVAPVGEELLCILAVPEEQVRLSGGLLGGVLEEAQKDLLGEKRRRFVRLTVPVVVLSSLFVWILYRQTRRSSRGRHT